MSERGGGVEEGLFKVKEVNEDLGCICMVVIGEDSKL